MPATNMLDYTAEYAATERLVEAAQVGDNSRAGPAGGCQVVVMMSRRKWSLWIVVARQLTLRWGIVWSAGDGTE
ncbi:MAG TPA: hypothetical protein VKT52_07420 [Ktedonobacterales bacterium]|nr:hypothetical protein [Ktedonobacterales bacterium]